MRGIAHHIIGYHSCTNAVAQSCFRSDGPQIALEPICLTGPNRPQQTNATAVSQLQFRANDCMTGVLFVSQHVQALQTLHTCADQGHPRLARRSFRALWRHPLVSRDMVRPWSESNRGNWIEAIAVQDNNSVQLSGFRVVLSATFSSTRQAELEHPLLNC